MSRCKPPKAKRYIMVDPPSTVLLFLFNTFALNMYPYTESAGAGIECDLSLCFYSSPFVPNARFSHPCFVSGPHRSTKAALHAAREGT